MCIGGVGHHLDAIQGQLHAGLPGSLHHLGLACTHGAFAAQALEIELRERNAFDGQMRQQLHTPPTHLHGYVGAGCCELPQRVVEIALADQAPGADEVEGHFDQ
ncbi:hypothetical protein D9M72_638740 [compost metagenome]